MYVIYILSNYILQKMWVSILDNNILMDSKLFPSLKGTCYKMNQSKVIFFTY